MTQQEYRQDDGTTADMAAHLAENRSQADSDEMTTQEVLAGYRSQIAGYQSEIADYQSQVAQLESDNAELQDELSEAQQQQHGGGGVSPGGGASPGGEEPEG